MAHPSASQPLSACKLLPAPLATLSAVVATKRRAISSLESQEPVKRAKLADLPDFKIPVVSRRALTPSTSTVAYSSSPNHALASSSLSRTRDTSFSRACIFNDCEQDVTLEPEAALVFGRHRNHTTVSRSDRTDLRTAVPNHLTHLLHNPESSARVVHLSRHASHASRVHAVVETTTDTLRILVVGQNGLRVISDGRVCRLLQGQRLDIPRDELGVQLDFYGSQVQLGFWEIEAESSERERLFTPEPAPQHGDLSTPPSPQSSMPPSSPPPIYDHQEHELESRDSSPLSSNSNEVDDDNHGSNSDDEEGEREVLKKEVKEELLENVTFPASSSRLPSPDPGLRAEPQTVDLPAILASTIVFSGSSKLSLPDLIKHMLEVSCPLHFRMRKIADHLIGSTESERTGR